MMEMIGMGIMGMGIMGMMGMMRAIPAARRSSTW